MKRINVVYIFSNVEKSLQLEWTLAALDKSKFDVHVILLGPGSSPMADYVRSIGLPGYQVYLGNNWSVPTAFFRVVSLIIKIKPRVVHAHLFHANVIGLTAAWLCRVPVRIYTRHHATIHLDHFPTAVRLDKWANRMATKIILPARHLMEILRDREGADPASLVVINHGFSLAAFQTVPTGPLAAIRKRYLPENQHPVIGVIARHTEWKGVQYVIEAFQSFLEKFPRAHLVMANATGDYHQPLVEKLKEIPPASYTMIPFEPDVISLYHCFDIFVHVPVDAACEAFGQTYVEALASGIPSVFTLSGVAPEFVKDGFNALVVPYRDSESVTKAMVRLMEDESLRNELIRQGRVSVNEKFSMTAMIQALTQLYLAA